MKATLCWNCQKACGGCSWSRAKEGKPVPGWEAIPSLLLTNAGYVTSYRVIKCPEFEKETRERRVVEADAS